MHTTETLKSDLKDNLRTRGLRALHGKLAFVHNGQVVDVSIERSLYRGAFVTILENGHSVHEFRARSGAYDWNAIAAAVIAVADARTPTQGRSGARSGYAASNVKLADDLRSMLGPGASPLSIEPSPAAPGRVRVKLNEVEMDALAVLQLFAALARHTPAPAAAH